MKSQKPSEGATWRSTRAKESSWGKKKKFMWAKTKQIQPYAPIANYFKFETLDPLRSH